jgi:hypothetical protein
LTSKLPPNRAWQFLDTYQSHHDTKAGKQPQTHPKRTVC